MDNSKYIPISCSFYDYLEEAATLKKISTIEYLSHKESVKIESRVKTLFIKDKVEFMELENGQSIRLDHLIKFNGKRLPKTC